MPRKPGKQLAISPEVLDGVWKQKSVKEAWGNLSDKYQIFFVFWLTNGRNGGKSYLATVNEKASIDVARHGASYILMNAHIGTIIDALRDGHKQHTRLTIERIHREAAEAEIRKDKPDHNIRLKAAEASAKYEGFLSSETGLNINSGVTNIQIVLPGKKS